VTTLGPLYPVGLVVRGQRCLVVGGGRVAARKVASLLECGAAVTMIAPEAHEALGLLSQSGAIAAIEGPPLDIQLRPYQTGEAAGYRLVVTATGDPEVDGAVHRDAEEAGVWVNSADDPAHCSFVLPAVWRSGPVSVAVSTAGASPALATWLRDVIGDMLGPELPTLAALLAEARRDLQVRGRSTEAVDWRAMLEGPLPGLVRTGRLDEARALLTEAVEVAEGPDEGSEGPFAP
jgi:precorrin-2 dehydrogenase/sirohydrochlorin ferrochelatase